MCFMNPEFMTLTLYVRITKVEGLFFLLEFSAYFINAILMEKFNQLVKLQLVLIENHTLRPKNSSPLKSTRIFWVIMLGGDFLSDKRHMNLPIRVS
jgi:hypothetical protein